jgi:hypothetical protein
MSDHFADFLARDAVRQRAVDVSLELTLYLSTYAAMSRITLSGLPGLAAFVAGFSLIDGMNDSSQLVDGPGTCPQYDRRAILTRS